MQNPYPKESAVLDAFQCSDKDGNGKISNRQYNSLLKCEFVSQILSSISPGCNDTVDAVHMLWRGFIVTAVGYLCLWITMLVTIGRMANADLMTDGGNFDAKKAGLV